jgi:hypothetical protein
MLYLCKSNFWKVAFKVRLMTNKINHLYLTPARLIEEVEFCLTVLLLCSSTESGGSLY